MPPTRPPTDAAEYAVMFPPWHAAVREACVRSACYTTPLQEARPIAGINGTLLQQTVMVERTASSAAQGRCSGCEGTAAPCGPPAADRPVPTAWWRRRVPGGGGGRDTSPAGCAEPAGDDGVLRAMSGRLAAFRPHCAVAALIIWPTRPSYRLHGCSKCRAASWTRCSARRLAHRARCDL